MRVIFDRRQLRHAPARELHNGDCIRVGDAVFYLEVEESEMLAAR